MDLERIRQGDEEALAELLEEAWAPLVRYLRTLTSGPDAAEDAAQEAFVRLWERRERWRAGTARGLLFRIGRNVVRDARRRAEVRRRFRARTDRVGPAPPTPADELSSSQLEAEVRAALLALPDRRRQVFELVHGRGLSYREAADALEISAQTVANLMSRALRELRERLAHVRADGPAEAGVDRREEGRRG